MKVQYHSEILRRSFDSESECLAAEKAATSFELQAIFDESPNVESALKALRPLGSAIYLTRRSRVPVISIQLNQFGRDVEALIAGLRNPGLAIIELNRFRLIRAAMTEAALAKRDIDDGRQVAARRKVVVDKRRQLMSADPEVQRLTREIHERSRQLKALSIAHDRAADASVEHGSNVAVKRWEAVPDWAKSLV